MRSRAHTLWAGRSIVHLTCTMHSTLQCKFKMLSSFRKVFCRYELQDTVLKILFEGTF